MYKPKVGDERWEVEWVVNIPKDDYGEYLLDCAEHKYHYCVTKEEAIEYAKSKVDEDFYGAAQIHNCIFTPYDEVDARLWPHVGYWEYPEHDTIEITHEDLNDH